MDGTSTMDMDLRQQPESPEAELRTFARSRIRKALLLAVGVALVLVLAGLKTEAKGVALGALFSALNFAVMSRTLAGRVERTGLAGKGFGLIWIVLRMALLAIPLVIAATTDFFGLAGTAGGLFAIQAVLLSEPLAAKIRKLLTGEQA